MAVRPARTELSPIAVIAAVLLAGLAGDGHSKVAAPSTTTVAHELAVPDPAGHRPDAPHAKEMPRYPTRADDGAVPGEAHGRHRYGAPEIVFVDPSVGDREALLRSLRPAVERFVLDPGRDGVRQMARLLRGRRGVQAIHIISHGGPGTLDLGAGVLDASRPPQAGAHALAALGAALAEDGDILIYGCNFGAGKAGRAAVRALARATGADVAASDDSTGAAALGGDWDLEVREGDVATRSAVAVADGWPGVLQPRLVPENQPINVRVTAHTNTLVFGWELTPSERHPEFRRVPHGDTFALEYRVAASGETFKLGGRTNSSDLVAVANVGIIDGLEPDTSYEIRIRWETPSSARTHGRAPSAFSPWSLLTARTKPVLEVDLKTARTLEGQDSFQGRVDMTAMWDTFLGTPRYIGDQQFLSLRRKGDSEHISLGDFRNFDAVDLTSGRGFGMSGLLRADTEYEVRLVVVAPRVHEDAGSTSHTYRERGLPRNAAFDVSEWVPVGPNAPPRFIEASWFHVWGEGRSGDERSIVAVTEEGVLYCLDLENRHEEVTIKCPPARATDPDGDTLTYWIPEEKGRSHASDKFEIDVSTGELRAKARGVADLAASLRPGEEYVLIVHVDDGRGGLDRMTVSFFLPSPLPIIKEPRSVLLVPSASDAFRRQGFVRVVNRDDAAGSVRIDAIDEAGTRYGPLTLEVGAHRTVHFNSADLERGNPGKGLDGVTGPGEGPWRLVLTSDLDLEVLAYVRTDDGFLTSMHDLAPRSEAGHRVAIFNPGRNTRQVSRLRLVNPGAEPAEVTIVGIDDRGESPGTPVVVSLPPGASRTLTARALESGEAPGLRGALGTGAGKWRLVVTAGQSIQVMNLLSSPTGHLTNLSTTPSGS